MKILIATDGSGASKSIVEAACEAISKPGTTTVKIISAIEPLAPMAAAAAPFAISTEYYGEVEEQAAKYAQEFTSDAAERLKKICPEIGNVSSEVIRSRGAGDCRGGAGLGRGFNRRRLARLRFLVARAARLGFQLGRASRALLGDDRARKTIVAMIELGDANSIRLNY